VIVRRRRGRNMASANDPTLQEARGGAEYPVPDIANYQYKPSSWEKYVFPALAMIGGIVKGTSGNRHMRDHAYSDTTNILNYLATMRQQKQAELDKQYANDYQIAKDKADWEADRIQNSFKRSIEIKEWQYKVQREAEIDALNKENTRSLIEQRETTERKNNALMAKYEAEIEKIKKQGGDDPQKRKQALEDAERKQWNENYTNNLNATYTVKGFDDDSNPITKKVHVYPTPEDAARAANEQMKYYNRRYKKPRPQSTLNNFPGGGDTPPVQGGGNAPNISLDELEAQLKQLQDSANSLGL